MDYQQERRMDQVMDPYPSFSLLSTHKTDNKLSLQRLVSVILANCKIMQKSPLKICLKQPVMSLCQTDKEMVMKCPKSMILKLLLKSY